MRLYDIEPVVKNILNKYPDTRNSDALLYVRLCKSINPAFSKMPFEKVILERRALGLPKMASVSRVRRKLQEDNAELRGTVNVTERRYENFKEVLDYVQN